MQWLWLSLLAGATLLPCWELAESYVLLAVPVAALQLLLGRSSQQSPRTIVLISTWICAALYVSAGVAPFYLGLILFFQLGALSCSKGHWQGLWPTAALLGVAVFGLNEAIFSVRETAQAIHEKLQEEPPEETGGEMPRLSATHASAILTIDHQGSPLDELYVRVEAAHDWQDRWVVGRKPEAPSEQSLAWYNAQTHEHSFTVRESKPLPYLPVVCPTGALELQSPPQELPGGAIIAQHQQAFRQQASPRAYQDVADRAAAKPENLAYDKTRFTDAVGTLSLEVRTDSFDRCVTDLREAFAHRFRAISQVGDLEHVAVVQDGVYPTLTRAQLATLGAFVLRDAGHRVRIAQGYYCRKGRDQTWQAMPADAHVWVEFEDETGDWIPLELSPLIRLAAIPGKRALPTPPWNRLVWMLAPILVLAVILGALLYEAPERVPEGTSPRLQDLAAVQEFCQHFARGGKPRRPGETLREYVLRLQGSADLDASWSDWVHHVYTLVYANAPQDSPAEAYWHKRIRDLRKS